MDKTLNRRVGFVKSANKAPGTQKKEKKAAVAPKKEVKITSSQVISWLKEHPMFKWGSMCLQIGIDKGNFARTMQSECPKIKPEIVLKIVSVISQYGFVPPNATNNHI